MTELAFGKMAREVAQGAVFPKGAIPQVPPFWFTYRDSGAFVSVAEGADNKKEAKLPSAPGGTDTNASESL